MTATSALPIDRFGPRGPQDLADLIHRHPLAWVCSRGPTGQLSTPLPLVPVFGADGAVAAVEGHFPRNSAHAAALREDPAATILFMGVQGYVSPSWMADRTQAPTWNYASAQLHVTLRFDEDPAALMRHLRDLTQRHEDGRTGAWRMEEMGPRLAPLASRIVAFRADVVDARQRYKLGQDERDDVFADIVDGLSGAGEDALVAWMRRFNPDRG